MVRIELHVHKIFFTVKLHDNRLRYIMDIFNNHLTTYSVFWNKYKRRPMKNKDKEYFSYIPRLDEYRYPINVLRLFMNTLGTSNIQKENIDVTFKKDYNYSFLNLNWNKNYIPRDYQEQYVNELTKDKRKDLLLVDLATGGGKGLIAMNSIWKINKRTAILVIPKYVDKWISDVQMYTDVDKEDIYVVQGGESLMNLMLEEDISYKFIIFSMRTVSNYITDYEEGKMPYPIQPPDLMDHLGIGVLLNDEMHQHFHALTKAMLYFDVEQTIGLSATLVSNRKEIDKIYSLIVPYENRISNIIKPDKFRHVRSIKYTLEMNRRIQYKRAKGYNHILFEQSICRNSIALRDYINMICYYVEIGYIQRYQPGEKLLIFAASIKLCTILTERLKQRYPKLDVRRFVEDDPYENIINAEISVSSIGSAGTAIDIPGLITCINTISMSSLQANLQAIGRLRKIPDREVWYYYIWTKDIPNQYKMHLDRFNAIKHDIKEYVEDEYPYTIKTT